MGAVLPMICRISLALSLCLTLFACGSAIDEDSAFGQSVAGVGRNQADFVPRFITLLENGAPTIQVGFIERETFGNLLLEHQKGDFNYWLSADGAHVILQNGILHSMRGFGEGLLASDLSEPLALVGGLRSGWSDRFHTYLDGNDFAVSRTYRCRIDNEGDRSIDFYGSPRGVILMRENCRSLDQEFTNLYWLDPNSRTIVLSRQWAGPYIGAISTRIGPQ
jgi:hypothetical protein